MSTFTVTTECGTSGDFETIRDAEAGKRTHEMLCEECDADEIHIQAAPEQSTLDGGNGSGPDIGSPSDNGAAETDEAAPDTDDPDPTDQDQVDLEVDENETADPDAETPARVEQKQAPVERDAERIQEGMLDSVRTDPLDVVPEYMIDEVEGQPTINKRGYAVIANRFDIVVNAEPITTAGETDHEYAEFRATAWRRGDDPEQSYTGHATARASESRRGMADNLNEMAETRAMKRAVAWASGVGILAWEEMAGYVDGEA